MPRRRTRRRRSRVSLSNGLIALLILLALYLYYEGYLSRWIGVPPPVGQDGPTAVPPVGQDGPTAVPGQPADITTFFTTPSLVYPDRRAQRGPSPLLNAVLADLNGAQRSIDVAVFDLDIPELTEALVGAQGRGVAVRVIVDSENLETPEVAEQTGRLQEANIPVRFDDREPFMHNKFIVVDENATWAGSWNMTENDTYRNNNNMVRFVNQQIAADYRSEFQQMFDGTFGSRKSSVAPYPAVSIGAAQVGVYFSPADEPARYVLERINAAQQSVRFMTFSYTSDSIAEAMIAKRQAGLTVQGVFESQNARGTGAEFAKLQGGGVDVLEDGNCYILHHKVIIIDDRIVITGSYNFTASAEESNDENLMIIDDPAVTQAYLGEFERLYAQAQAPTRCGS